MIIQSNRRRNSGTWQLLSPVGICVVLVWLGQPSFLFGQQPPARVVVGKVFTKELNPTQQFVATVLPSKKTTIGSAVDGRVAERFFDVGDRVKKDRPLFQLLTKTIGLELEVAQAELRLRKKELEEMKNGSRPSVIDQAKAKMLAAEAYRDYTRSEFERLKKLKDANAIPQKGLDEAASNYEQAEQTFLDLQAAYKLVNEGPRAEQIEQAEATVAIQEARIEQIKDRISKYTIASRFNGYVVNQHVEVGAWVRVGEPLVDVVALDEIELQAFVGEESVPHIEPGAEVRFAVPALPGKTFTGTVKNVVPQADAKSRTFPVLIRAANELVDETPELKSGFLARVELPVGPIRETLLVSKDAIVLGGPSPLVYRVDAGTNDDPSIAVPVPVELGSAQGNLIEVTGELAQGQSVVIEGNERLRPQQEVVVVSVK